MICRLIAFGLAFLLTACSTLTPKLDEAEQVRRECESQGGSIVFDQSTLTVKCEIPQPGEPEPGPEIIDVDPLPEPVIPKPEPEPEPKPEPVGEWRTLAPGEYIQLPFTGRLEFFVTGIDTRIVKEWHLIDLADGRGRGIETANAHLMIYDDKTLYFIQQVYKPKHTEARHEDYWAFRPDREYRFTLDATPQGYNLKIFQDGSLVVDMPRASFGPWPVMPFAKIDNIRLGAGVFSGYSAPYSVKIKMVE